MKIKNNLKEYRKLNKLKCITKDIVDDGNSDTNEKLKKLYDVDAIIGVDRKASCLKGDVNIDFNKNKIIKVKHFYIEFNKKVYDVKGLKYKYLGYLDINNIKLDLFFCGLPESFDDGLAVIKFFIKVYGDEVWTNDVYNDMLYNLYLRDKNWIVFFEIYNTKHIFCEKNIKNLKKLIRKNFILTKNLYFDFCTSVYSLEKNFVFLKNNMLKKMGLYATHFNLGNAFFPNVNIYNSIYNFKNSFLENNRILKINFYSKIKNLYTFISNKPFYPELGKKLLEDLSKNYGVRFNKCAESEKFIKRYEYKGDDHAEGLRGYRLEIRTRCDKLRNVRDYLKRFLKKKYFRTVKSEEIFKLLDISYKNLYDIIYKENCCFSGVAACFLCEILYNEVFIRGNIKKISFSTPEIRKNVCLVYSATPNEFTKKNFYNILTKININHFLNLIFSKLHLKNKERILNLIKERILFESSELLAEYITNHLKLSQSQKLEKKYCDIEYLEDCFVQKLRTDSLCFAIFYDYNFLFGENNMWKKIVKENDLFENPITCQSVKLSVKMLFSKKRKKYFTQLVKYFKLTRKDCKELSYNEINQIKYGFYIYKNDKDAQLLIYQNTSFSFHFTYNFDSFKTVINDLRFDSEVFFEIQPLSERLKLINLKDEDLEIYNELIISDVHEINKEDLLD